MNEKEEMNIPQNEERTDAQTQETQAPETQAQAEEKAAEEKEKPKDKKEEKEASRRELQKQVNELTGKNAALSDKLKEENERFARMMAEYENFRKRSQKEKDGIFADAYAEALGEIVPMVDNLERALGCADEQKLREGLQMVMTQFSDTLNKLGIESFGQAGETFDPNIHHAIMHDDDVDQPENTVSMVFQKGYKKGDKVIRCAMVKVVN